MSSLAIGWDPLPDGETHPRRAGCVSEWTVDIGSEILSKPSTRALRGGGVKPAEVMTVDDHALATRSSPKTLYPGVSSAFLGYKS